MKKIVFLSIIAFSLLVIIPVAAKGKDEAPGQVNKETNIQSNNSNAGGSKVTIGSVDEVKKNSVVVEDKKGNNKTEGTIDTKTKIVGHDKKEIKIGAIKLKDIIALISTESAETTSGSGKFKVKKIFIKEASESAQIKRSAISGVIVDISGSTITVAHQIQRDRLYKVITNAQTEITGKSSEASASAEASGSATPLQLAVGMRIAAVGENVNGSIVAKRIHIIPGKAIGVFKKNPVATPSASLTPSGTPSASLSPSSTPSATPISLIEPSASP